MCRLIFDLNNIKTYVMYGSTELSDLTLLYSTSCNAELHDEQKTLRNILKYKQRSVVCLGRRLWNNLPQNVMIRHSHLQSCL